MHPLNPTRVLIVAHQTADSAELAAVVRQRLRYAPLAISLCGPHIRLFVA